MTAIEPLPSPPRGALRVMQLGAISVVLVAATLQVFELDRFFIPKELVLHLTALVAAFFATRLMITRVDRWLLLFLLVSAISAIFATNHWLAMRAVAIGVSGVVLFWIARALRDGGLA